RVLRCLPYPIVDFRWLDRVSLEVEQIQNPVGNIQLVDRVQRLSPRSSPLHLSYPRGTYELQRRTVERVVELLRELVTDDREQPSAEQQDYQAEGCYVPDCESQPESDEPLYLQSRRRRFSHQNGIRRRAQS